LSHVATHTSRGLLFKYRSAVGGLRFTSPV
jgi:hypothetical protein